jgi:hypothetical protein
MASLGASLTGHPGLSLLLGSCWGPAPPLEVAGGPRPLSPAGSPPAAQLEPKRARQFGGLDHYGSDYGASGSDEDPGSGDVSMVEGGLWWGLAGGCLV